MPKTHSHAYISIEDGCIKVEYRDGKKPGSWRYAANEQGAEAVGKKLYKRRRARWIYASSVDHPDEYDAPDLDFRTLIEDAFAKEAGI